jgi:two-component system, OmpR family, phosphate regulon response regulator PhoB
LAIVLIVDDEEPVREALAYVLTAKGYEVRLAIHGAQALELIAQEHPDLVLTDVMMPVLNGVELCRRLKAREDTQNIPVILMTASGRNVTDGAGGDAYLAKPFSLPDVEAVVAQLLSGVH